ncbi:MAG: hypothetical protein KF712_18145 [Akkermansiaceae bacterium]|nr:hypothetical protein [Akkermansiaceae bacterium]
MSSCRKWFYSLLVLTGIFVSWEPGAETTGHAHAHAAGHELQPPHCVDDSVTASGPGGESSGGDTMTPRPLPADYHYHTVFDFSSETCTDQHADAFRVDGRSPVPCPSLVATRPDSPFPEVELPPLI